MKKFLIYSIKDAKVLFGDSDELVAWKYESEERASKLTEIEESQVVRCFAAPFLHLTLSQAYFRKSRS